MGWEDTVKLMNLNSLRMEKLSLNERLDKFEELKEFYKERPGLDDYFHFLDRKMNELYGRRNIVSKEIYYLQEYFGKEIK